MRIKLYLLLFALLATVQNIVAAPTLVGQTTTCLTASPWNANFTLNYASGNDRYVIIIVSYNGTTGMGTPCGGGKFCGVSALTYDGVAGCWGGPSQNRNCTECSGICGGACPGVSTATCIRQDLWGLDDDMLNASTGSYTVSVTVGACYSASTELCITFQEWVDVNQTSPNNLAVGSCSWAGFYTNGGSGASVTGTPPDVDEDNAVHVNFTTTKVDHTSSDAPQVVAGTADAGTGGFYIGSSYEVVPCPGAPTPCSNSMTENFAAGGSWLFKGFWFKDGSVSLPVSLLFLNARYTFDDQVLIQWSTATEKDNDYFTVQRTQDGLYFEDVGTVKGSGNSKYPVLYSFTDESPLSGKSYYRLKQTDYDGKHNLTQLVAVNPKSNKLRVEVFPNPVNSENINISITGAETDKFQKIDVKIYNAMGGVVYKNSYLPSHANLFKIGNYSLAKGNYFLVASQGDKLVTKNMQVY